MRSVTHAMKAALSHMMPSLFLSKLTFSRPTRSVVIKLDRHVPSLGWHACCDEQLLVVVDIIVVAVIGAGGDSNCTFGVSQIICAAYRGGRKVAPVNPARYAVSLCCTGSRLAMLLIHSAFISALDLHSAGLPFCQSPLTHAEPGNCGKLASI